MAMQAAAKLSALTAGRRWQRIKAQSLALLARKPWDESEHPRVPAGSPDAGQFAPSGGGSGSPQGELFPGKFPPLPEPVKEVTDQDFKDKVKLSDGLSASEKGEFFKLWNERVKEAPEEFRQEFMGGLDGTMTIGVSHGTWEIRGKIHDEHGEVIGTYTRSIDFEGNTASSDYFVINRGHTGKDIGKKMLAANVAKYQELGLDRVEVTANIDVGGYAWAKYGYVPTEDAWRDLASSLYEKVGSGGGYMPESWDELTNDQHDEIKNAWKQSTADEFYDSEVENWRDSGQAMADAKTQLAGTFDTFDEKSSKWAYDGLKGYGIVINPNDPNAVSQLIGPFLAGRNSSIDHVLANTTIEYKDNHGDGREDPEVTIDAAATPELTDDQRAQIESALVEVFNKEAESRAPDLDPPEYLRDGIDDHQEDIWDSMHARDKFLWARDNGMIEETESDSEIDEDDANDIRTLLDEGDPKAIWSISDFRQRQGLATRHKLVGRARSDR